MISANVEEQGRRHAHRGFRYRDVSPPDIGFVEAVEIMMRSISVERDEVADLDGFVAAA